MSFRIESGKLLKYYPEKSETDVVIPDYVQVIGKQAFARCKNLHSVIIPESVVEIEKGAFLWCSDLLYIDIPDSVEKIGYEAFHCCLILERVKLPRALKFLGDYAFSECGMLHEIVIPDGVTKIENFAFYVCTSLAHVKLPKDLTEIGKMAFSGCLSLRSIEIPEGVTFIGEGAFSGSGLSRAIIPRSIKTIDYAVFHDTDDLVTNIPISDWQGKWGISREGYALNFMNTYSPDDPFLEGLKEENNQGIEDFIYDIELNFSPKDDIKALRYLIKEKLLEVEDVEFFSEKLIGDPEMEAMLLDYKNAHFSAEYMEQWERDRLDKALGIKEYTRRELSRSFQLVKTNGEYGIKRYRGSDTTVIVPGKIDGLPVTDIFEDAFYALGNIRSVFIEEGIVRIETGAFEGCPRLTEVTLPESLEGINDEAFSECINLTEITIPSNVVYIGEAVFSGCSRLARATLPDEITTIEPSAFSRTAISEILIPEGVEVIKEYAFYSCEKLSKVTLPRGLKSIRETAFAKCRSLKRIVLYGELCSISPTAFADIPELTIAAPPGSYAMKFALDNGYRFEPLEPEKEE